MASKNSVAAEFDRLVREFDACIAEVIEIATIAGATDGAAWGCIVKATTGEPPDILVTSSGAANPAQVRKVLLGVQAAYEQRLHDIEHMVRAYRPADEVVDAIWEFRHRRLDRFVAEEVAAYIKVVAPRPSVGSVFAKAAKRAPNKPPTAMPTSSSQLYRCKTCSAPRLRDHLYGNCVYCGHPFFTGREEVT